MTAQKDLLQETLGGGANGDAVACSNLGPDTGLGYIGDNSCFGDCDGNGGTCPYTIYVMIVIIQISDVLSKR